MEINNRSQALHDREENVKNSNTNYTNIISAHEDVVRKYIPVKNKGKQHVPWLNDIVEKRKSMLEALEYSNRVKTRDCAKKLDDPKIQLEEAYFKEQENYVHGKVHEIRAAEDHRKSKIVWETVRIHWKKTNNKP